MDDSSPGDEIEVLLDKDHTRAEVVLGPGVDPSSVDLSLVQALLRDRRVAIDEAVEAALERLAVAEAGIDGLTFVVAEWTAPVHGRDGGIEWCDGFEPEPRDGSDAASDAATDAATEATHAADRPVAAAEVDARTTSPDLEAPVGGDDEGDGEDDDEKVDFYNQRSYRTVNVGDHLANLVPPTSGEDGRNVIGATVRAKPGRKIETSIDQDTVEVDGERILAKVPGLVRFSGKRLWIERHLEIEGSVDFNTGNIDFDGSVTVGDSVKHHFVVRATGDVSVLGLVEGATLMVGGKLYLRRGMAAKERGQVLVDGPADVGFLNNVRGRIRGDLVARRELIDCEMVVGGRLVGPQAAVIGGKVAVTGSVEIAVIGSGGGTATRLVLGEVPLLGAAITRIDDLVRAWRTQSQAKAKEVAAIQYGGKVPGAEERVRIGALRDEAIDIDRRIDAAERRRANLIEEIQRSTTVELVVNRRIFPKSELVIGGRAFVVTDEIRGPVRIETDAEGLPVVTSQGRDPRPISDFVEERDLAA